MSQPSTELSLTVHSDSATYDVAAPPTSAHDRGGTTQTQVGKLAQEMAEAWRAGHRLFAEAFLDRYPELRDNRDAVLRLVCEELSLRETAGIALNREDILRRFPRWTVELQALLDCHELIDSDDPSPPDNSRIRPLLQEFEILAELGEGAQGQVYLARQRSLANRPLVVKVSSRKGNEHVSLARLQHTNIVPLYWVKEDSQTERRTLCMPYFGKVTLTAILKAMNGKSVSERSGKDIVDVLDRARETMALDQPGLGPVRAYYLGSSYVTSVCWIGACLADALEYAHQRGLVHLDVKPSNVLLANDGQPMLLDFHLSREPLIPGQTRPTRMGGTPMYMSPEQHAAMAALADGRDIPLVIDGRSDIYSLGLILYQLLGGKVPLASSPPRLDKLTPAVSCGLADVIEKCLAPSTDDRYATAADLAADLKRHIHHRPLRGVRNRSWKECWQKYRRRQPHGLTIVALVLLLFSITVAAGLWITHTASAHRHERRQRIAAILSDGLKYLEAKNPSEAARLAREGLKLANTDSDRPLQAELSALLHKAERSDLLATLHVLTEKLRFAVAEPTSPKQIELEKACRRLWQAHDKILAISAEDAGKEAVEQAKVDLVDLAVLSAHFRTALAAPSIKQEVCREALASLLDAERALGSSPVLAREIVRHSGAGGVAGEIKPTRPPQSAWEHYALGRSFLLEEAVTEAARHFEESLRLDPQGFWPNFSDGLCAYRMNRYADSVAAFRAALVARPCAPAYYNRGLAHSRLNDTHRAEEDYTQAMSLDPRFAPALFARGVLYLEQEDFARALEDIRQSLQCGHDPADAHYHMALAYLGLKQHANALASLDTALRHRPEFNDALRLRAKLNPSR